MSETHTAAVIAIGSEMLGPIRLDTNSLKITAALERCGIPLVRKSVVADRQRDIAKEILFSLQAANILVITGGLGPTEDDLTRESLIEALGLKTEIDAGIVERLQKRFAARGLEMAEVNKKQAIVFPGQTTLANEKGTAPGFHIQHEGKHVWVFPGVPNELEWMISTYFAPWLAEACAGEPTLRRVLKIAGLPESTIDERLKPYYQAHPGEELTILATNGHIELHLIGPDQAAIDSREAEVQAIFGERVFGYDDDTMEGVVGLLLNERNATLAVAESCTGGLMSSRITDVSGSSKYFLGGAVCYTAQLKRELADVPEELIREHGEVSEPVAIALAQGIRARVNATYGIGITGIAGPTGGSDEKPVGTVHIAVASESGVEHRRFLWPMGRALFKWFTTQAALDLLRLTMLRKNRA